MLLLHYFCTILVRIFLKWLYICSLGFFLFFLSSFTFWWSPSCSDDFCSWSKVKFPLRLSSFLLKLWDLNDYAINFCSRITDDSISHPNLERVQMKYLSSKKVFSWSWIVINLPYNGCQKLFFFLIPGWKKVYWSAIVDQGKDLILEKQDWFVLKDFV